MNQPALFGHHEGEVARGDIWFLDRHVLLVGDATRPSELACEQSGHRCIGSEQSTAYAAEILSRCMRFTNREPHLCERLCQPERLC